MIHRWISSSLVLYGVLSISGSGFGDCVYKIKDGSTKLQWTGYKFSEKLGVSGTFDAFKMEVNEKAKSEEKLFESLNYSIETASMNSGMPLRDKKLVLFLFGSIENSGEISGNVTKVDFKKGKAFAEISMNGKTLKKEFKAEKSQNHYTFTSEIDLKDFGMMSSVSQLAEACKALHTGSDGVAKTWSLVGLKIEADTEEVCGKG